MPRCGTGFVVQGCGQVAKDLKKNKGGWLVRTLPEQITVFLNEREILRSMK